MKQVVALKRGKRDDKDEPPNFRGNVDVIAKSQMNILQQQNRDLAEKLKVLESQKGTSSLAPSFVTLGRALEGWETDKIPLPELTRSDERDECPEGLYHVDMIVNLTADAGAGMKIPKIVHQTGEGKCLTGAFYKNAVKWSLEGHSFYFHDAEAKTRLLQK